MKKKILIIDDEPMLVELLKETLVARYRVFTAYDGDDGIEIARQEVPDLILCDLGMPRTDGYQVLKELKIHEDTKNIPFIVLTGREDTGSIYKAQALGASDYLIKPMHLEDVPKIAEKYLY